MIITWSLRRVTNVRLAESVGDFVLQTQIAYQRKSKNGPKVHETLSLMADARKDARLWKSADELETLISESWSMCPL